MRICKEKERTEVDSATVQRGLRKEALSQRVHKEAEHPSEDAEMQAESTTPEDHDSVSGPNFISQDDDIFEEESESPARRTISRTTARTITQEVLMQVMDIRTKKKAFSAEKCSIETVPVSVLGGICKYSARCRNRRPVRIQTSHAETKVP